MSNPFFWLSRAICFSIISELEKKFGEEEDLQPNKIESKILSDCCESLIGAIYIDRGFDISSKFVLNSWKDFLKISF